MPDPFSMSSGAISTVQGIWQFLSFIRTVTDSGVIAAYFGWDGTHLEGSEKIVVEKINDTSNSDQWWYFVKEELDYVYVRYPVVESCAHELVGQEVGHSNPNARFWRWVAPVEPGAIVGGNRPNLEVNFVVVGYRPKALVAHFRIAT